MFKKSFYLLLTVAVFVLIFCGCSISTIEKTEQFQKDYSSTGVTALKVVNITGNVTISKNDSSSDAQIHVYALKRTYSISNDELSYVTVTVTEGASMKIESVYKQSANVSVDYTIKIPANISVDIDNTTGSLNIDGVTSAGSIKTTTGNISLNGVTSAGSINTTTGDIKIKNVTYISTVISTTGALDINIGNIKNDMSLSTTTGAIKVYFAPNLNANLTTSKLTGSINTNGVTLAGTFKISISVITGDITLNYIQ